MANIEELQRALRQGSDAKARLSGLDEQYQQAQDRGVATTKKDQYGQVSPLSVLADVVGQSRSRRDMRELTPQREAARSNIAQNEHAGALYNAVRQQKRDNVSDEQFGITHGLNKARQAEVARQNQIKNDRYTTEQGQVKTPPVQYTDAEGNTRQLVSLGDGRWMDENRNIITSIAGWTKAAEKSITSDGNGYTDKSANARAEKAINSLGAANRAVGLYRDLAPETLARLSSRSSRVGKTAMNMLLPKDVASYVKSEVEKDPQVKQYFSALAKMSAEERHAMFGGALTTYEGMSGDDFLAFVINMTPAEQQQRVQNSVAGWKQQLKTADSVHGGKATKYQNALAAQGYKNLTFDTNEPQGGSVNANLIGSREDIQSEDGTPSADAKTLDQYRDRTPPEALAMLRANPELLADFIESYGWNPDEEMTR